MERRVYLAKYETEEQWDDGTKVGFVLAVKIDDYGKLSGYDPFVTWGANFRPDGRIETYWGRYFSDITKAVFDYNKRIKEATAVVSS